MFRRILLGVLCAHFLLAAKSDVAAANETVEYDTFVPIAAVPVKDDFDWKLLQKFTSSKGHKNVILSPFSLKLVLALLYDGAGGDTEKEFRTVLRFPENRSLIEKEYSDLLDMLVEKRNSYIINIGTQIFLDSHLAPNPTYQTKAQAFYHTSVAKTNFSNPPEASSHINNWVEILTNGKIKSFVKSDDVENAVMLAANAVFFKGTWLLPFPSNESFSGNFYSYGSDVVEVQYMKQTNKFYYFDSKTLNSQILRIPYKGRKFALYIILPNSRDGLSYLMDHLDVREITMSIHLADLKPVTIILPKFRFDFQARYSQILREFGFDTLFTGHASFPGIIQDREAQLVVTDILQKSGIEVNEEGSTIYTTTQVTIGNKFGGESISVFNASRPFIFYVQEEISNNILFIGKVENPLDSDAIPLPPRYGDDTSSIPAVPFSTPSQSASPIPALGSEFDLVLLKNSIGTSKNVFLSPASVKISLAMLAEAADGSTANEIYTVLRLPHVQRHHVIQNLINELGEHHPNSLLKFQNALFVSDKEKINPNYQTVAQQYYKTYLKRVNYQNKALAAQQINNFVYDATMGLIPSILSQDEIDPSTQLILTNALYFNASWKIVFEKKLTRRTCFHTAKGCVNIQLMQMIDNLGYLETQNAQIVRIPYAGETRAMLLVLPKEKDLLTALHDLELYPSFGHLVTTLNETEIELLMPKFDIEYGFDLVYTLKKMDIKEVFSSNANLPHFFEGGKLGVVDSFIHKAKIEVTEEGTKASAVSLISVIPLMGSSTPKVRADHPFAFFIYNTRTNTILFEGILKDPPQSSLPEPKTGNVYDYVPALNNRLPTQVQDDVQRIITANRF